MGKREENKVAKDYHPSVLADLLDLIDKFGTDKAYQICKDQKLKEQKEIFEKLYL
jgi:hypothetical protein